MKIYDVSMLISEDVQVYKNKEEKKPKFINVSNFSNASAYETQVLINLHTGTHMDFPLHMIPDGKTSDTLDLSKLIRSVKVFDLTHVHVVIDRKDLQRLDLQPQDFVLFKTQNSYQETFNFRFVYVNQDAASYLVSKGVVGVGIDALGIERDQSGHPTHHILMNQDVIIIEGLRLKDVPEGRYHMFALPIKMKGVEALLLSIILVEGFYDSSRNT
jgi:arylformamidase